MPGADSRAGGGLCLPLGGVWFDRLATNEIKRPVRPEPVEGQVAEQAASGVWFDRLTTNGIDGLTTNGNRLAESGINAPFVLSLSKDKLQNSLSHASRSAR